MNKNIMDDKFRSTHLNIFLGQKLEGRKKSRNSIG